jgi:hypothetical protein
MDRVESTTGAAIQAHNQLSSLSANPISGLSGDILASLDLAYLEVGQNHLKGLAAAKRAIGEETDLADR